MIFSKLYPRLGKLKQLTIFAENSMFNVHRVLGTPLGSSWYIPAQS